jgi:hypothetical protein
MKTNQALTKRQIEKAAKLHVVDELRKIRRRVK